MKTPRLRDYFYLLSPLATPHAFDNQNSRQFSDLIKPTTAAEDKNYVYSGF